MDVDYTQVFVKEFGLTRRLPYVFSPVSLLSCLVTLTSGLVIMPIIGPIITAKYGQLSLDKRRSFNTILGSNIHHLTVSTLSFYALISGALSNRIISDSTLGFALMQTSLGYFVGDTILMLHNPKMRFSVLDLFHHFMGILGYMLALTAQGKGMFFPVSFQVVEFSSVFMNTQRAMSMSGVSKDSHAYRTISHITVVTYFFTRLATIPWLWYELIMGLLDPASLTVPLYFRMYSIVHFMCIHPLFLYWFPLIVRKSYFRSSSDKLLKAKST